MRPAVGFQNMMVQHCEGTNSPPSQPGSKHQTGINLVQLFVLQHACSARIRSNLWFRPSFRKAASSCPPLRGLSGLWLDSESLILSGRCKHRSTGLNNVWVQNSTRLRGLHCPGHCTVASSSQPLEVIFS